MKKQYKHDQLGLEVELGKFARQANGSVWLKHGNNIVLATATASKDQKDFIGFFPLTVEYREKMAAAGKIPGGYIKREGRLSEREILSSRLIDRPIRPLFPKYYFNEVQVLASVHSADGEYPTDILGFIASSLALTISDIPFQEPAGAVHVGKMNGELKFNLSHEEMKESDINITVAGTQNGISMVEGNCNKLTEAELTDLLFKAHDQIKMQVEWQLNIQKEIGKPKASLENQFDWEGWDAKVKSALPADYATALFSDSKEARSKVSSELKQGVLDKFAAELEAGDIAKSQISFLFDSALKDGLPDSIVAKGTRIDGRAFDEVRPLEMEVSLLPKTHGSSLFQRGETQALVSTTLGTGQDAQKYEPLIGSTFEKTFMLHYNFPPFCTGEVKPMRGVSRREIGHGYLAERSFDYVLPEQAEFPYTIRINSEVLESNGSSSMATVCGTSLALMDAGVPLDDVVGGIAMGLIKDSSGNYQTLTDILGTEDALGLMDFKITGTENHITAIQMDIKEKGGLPREVLQKALDQAKAARVHIITEMKKCIAAPRSEVSMNAPRITTLTIDKEKIGLLIGPGGKTIKEIIAQTGVEIDIEEDGTVKIFSRDGEASQKATKIIKGMTGEVKVGEKFEGTVKRTFDYGLLVELLPGKAGLVHISAIAKPHHSSFSTKFPEESTIHVEVVEVDRRTGRIKLVAPELK